MNCVSCGKNGKKHVNDVRAEPNQQILLIGLAIGIIASFILFLAFGGIGTLGFVIPLLFMNDQMNGTKGFNSFLIKRK